MANAVLMFEHSVVHQNRVLMVRCGKCGAAIGNLVACRKPYYCTNCRRRNVPISIEVTFKCPYCMGSESREELNA